MKTYKTTYSNAVKFINNMIMLNNIEEIDNNFFEENIDIFYKESENEEDEPQAIEIFQYYITDCSKLDVEFLKENFPGLIFGYSNLLDKYILCVDHWGTPWSGVYFETTNKEFAEECE